MKGMSSSRRLLLAGAVLTVIGLAIAGALPLAGTDDSGLLRTEQAVGGVLALAGWAALAWGIHRFGREG